MLRDKMKSLPSLLSRMPLERRYHILGVGGIGMSALAMIMHEVGYHVSGSDVSEGDRVKALRRSGMTIYVGHAASNVHAADYVIRSTAVGDENVEVVEARKLGKPVVSRAELLAHLVGDSYTVCISGTHGKTTVTSLLGHLMVQGGLDPTVISGGIVHNWSSNARLGRSRWCVIEADESDKTLVALPRTVVIVTNIDDDHQEVLGNREESIRLFVEFVSGVSFYGFALLCIDDLGVRTMLSMLPDDVKARCLTYSIQDSEADFYASDLRCDVRGMFFNVKAKHEHALVYQDLYVPLMGRHNLSNAVAATIMFSLLNGESLLVPAGLKSFAGVARRMDEIGKPLAGVCFYDDYAHHPSEIKASIEAARDGGAKRVFAVVQPHRYSRLRFLFQEFVEVMSLADRTVLLDVFAAGEPPDAMDSGALCKASAPDEVLLLNDVEEIARAIHAYVREGDTVLFMGAGSITKIARDVYGAFEKLFCRICES